MDKKIQIPINDTFSLDMGTIIERTIDCNKPAVSFLKIAPPQNRLLYQLIDWLNAQPEPDIFGSNAYRMGIGAVALCIRWGTWLAVLMHSYPARSSKIDSDEIFCRISNTEMKRINIEASANLAWLLMEMANAPDKMDNFLHKAYYYLPFPVKKVNIGRPFYYGISSILRSTTSESFSPIPNDKAFRIIANRFVHDMYRNGEVEDYHSDDWKGGILTEQRINLTASRKLLKPVAENFTGALENIRYQADIRWIQTLASKFSLYDFGWTVEDVSSEMRLAVPSEEYFSL